MGNFDSRITVGVNRIGNRIEQIIYWWSPYKNEVNITTVNYMKCKKSTILGADNPRNVARYLGVSKESNELDKKSRIIYKVLSASDKRRVDLIADEDFY